jgi:adenine-specific DNA methylase
MLVPTIVIVDDDYDYFETTMKTLKTTMGLEIIKMKMKMNMNMKINKALIACSKNVADCSGNIGSKVFDDHGLPSPCHTSREALHSG